MQVVVEVAAVLAWHGVRYVLAAGRHPDDAYHRPYRKPDLVVEVDDAVFDGQHLRDGRPDDVYELAVAGNDGGDALGTGSDV